MSFYYLLVGHVLGDFTFQTNKIAYKKNVDIKWLLLHIIIVTICIIGAGVLYGRRILLVAALNGIIHFLIDFRKPKLDNAGQLAKFLYFIGDQLVHVFVLFILSSLLKEPMYEIDSRIVLTTLVILFTVSFSSVTIQFLLKLVEQLKDRSFYVKNEKSLGNANRICIFFSLYMSQKYAPVFILAIPIMLLVFWLYYNIKLRSWMTLKYFIAKMTFELLFAYTGFFTFINFVR